MSLRLGNTVGRPRKWLLKYEGSQTANRFAPHDTAHLVNVMGGNVSLSLIERCPGLSYDPRKGLVCVETGPLLRGRCNPTIKLCMLFIILQAGYYQAGNEPSFQVEQLVL